MRRPNTSPTGTPAAVALVIAILTAGCVGKIESPGNDRPGGSAGTSGSGLGTPSPSPGSGGQSGQGASAPGTGGAAGTSASVTGQGGAPSLSAIATRYFPGQSAVNPPKRVVRLSRTQLDVTTRTLLPKLTLPSAATAMPRDPLQTNYEYADNLTFNPANFPPFASWVSGVAGAVKAAPDSVIDCAASSNSATCLAEQAKKFVRQAFRGTPSDAQVARYADFFSAGVAAVGLPSATAELVDVTLTSPSYVFRDEVLADGSGVLLPPQLLQHITYTLADAPPETVGLSSTTASTYLQTPEVTRKTIEQVLASPQARDKLVRFWMAWLEVKEPDEFTIASSAFPEFTPAVANAVVAETRTFLERQLGQAAPRMKDLTESTQSFISNTEAFLYGVSAPAMPRLLDLDPTQRLGIFTQPAVLASHSGPTTSRLIKRGVFFVRKVMCIPLGTPPPGIDITIPVTAGATERQRVETVTAQTKCVGCHASINPFGFMLENFDAVGRWRTIDEGAPIDARIAVTFLDEGPVMTSSPVDALRVFTRSWRFQQCFARQVFRFYAGRDETAGDDPVLRQMFFDFASGGEQDIVGMLRTMASAPAFSRRAEVP